MHLADYIKNKIPFWPNWINFILLKCNIFGARVYGRTYMTLLQDSSEENVEKKLLQIVNYAINNVPYYRKRYKGIELNSIEEFENTIQIIDKNEVIAHWEDFIDDRIDWKKVKTGTTGGTSGKSLNLIEPQNRYSYSLAYLHKYWFRFGWNYHTRGIFRNWRFDNSRDYIISPFLKEVIFDSFRMNRTYAKICWQTLQRFNIKFIHAYPSAFYDFCKFCKNQNLDLGFIKAAFLASEGITHFQKELFDELGIKIATFYGHSEKLIFAHNNPDSDAFEIENYYGYCEIIDKLGNRIKRPNITGELVGTTFFNYHFPLIRYRTGDFSSYQDSKLKFLSHIDGRRKNNLIYKSNGSTISTTALITHGEVLLHVDGIQYMQQEIGKLIVLVVKNDQYSDIDEKYLLTYFQNAMGSNDSVTIQYVDKLIVQNNGKFLPLISNI